MLVVSRLCTEKNDKPHVPRLRHQPWLGMREMQEEQWEQWCLKCLPPIGKGTPEVRGHRSGASRCVLSNTGWTNAG